jgi:hypothetical protein
MYNPLHFLFSLKLGPRLLYLLPHPEQVAQAYERRRGEEAPRGRHATRLLLGSSRRLTATPPPVGRALAEGGVAIVVSSSSYSYTVRHATASRTSMATIV